VQARQPEAETTARKAAALLPDHPNVLDTLGVALGLAHKQEEAVSTLRTAVNLAPTAFTPKQHLAEALVAAGDRNGAEIVVKSINASRLNARDKASLDSLTAALKSKPA
jgi:Flp pilus assembly protein TadD